MQNNLDSLLGRTLIFEVSPEHSKKDKCERLKQNLIEVSLGRKEPKSCITACYSLKVKFELDDTENTAKVIIDIQDDVKKCIGFKQEISGYNIPQDVLETACQIHSDLRLVKKQGNRPLMKFAIVYYAYKKLDIAVIPQILAKTMGVKEKDVAGALSLVVPIVCGVAVRQINFPPDRYTEYLLSIMDVDSSISNNINDVINSILHHEPTIFDRFKPQDVSYCSIVKFCDKFQYKYTISYKPKELHIKLLNRIFDDWYEHIRNRD